MKNKVIVEKILKYISKIIDYTKEVDYDSFIKNSILVEACVFNLVQLGETSHKISDEFKKLHPEIAWRELNGLRNRLVHDYQGVNLNLVWEIISTDLPTLRQQLENLI